MGILRALSPESRTPTAVAHSDNCYLFGTFELLKEECAHAGASALYQRLQSRDPPALIGGCEPTSSALRLDLFYDVVNRAGSSVPGIVFGQAPYRFVHPQQVGILVSGFSQVLVAYGIDYKAGGAYAAA